MDKYVIDYYIDGVVKETIYNQNPVVKPVAKWLANRLSKSTHKLGKLVVRKV